MLNVKLVNNYYVVAEALIGSTLEKCVKKGIELSKEYNSPVLFNFNEVNIKCDKNSDVDDIVNYWNLYTDLNRINYHNSQEWFDKEIKRSELKARDQKTLDENLKKYATLDFTNRKQVLNWFMKNLDLLASDLTYDRTFIIKPLEDAGYTPSMCTGADYVETIECKEKWIIGQLMVGFFPALVNYIIELNKIR